MHGVGVSAHRLRQAARTLAEGGLIAHATEGVWGLAADAYDADAVLRVVAAKHRDPGLGVIVVAADADQLAPLVAPEAGPAWQRAVESWPGSNTWLLPARVDAPWWLTGGRSTIALRETAHALTRALCREFGGPIISTSANISGKPPVASAWRARAVFAGTIDMVLGGVLDTPGRPSTIRNATTNEIIRG